MREYKARCDDCDANMQFGIEAERDEWVENHSQFFDPFSLKWHDIRTWEEQR